MSQIDVREISKDEWNKISYESHLLVFNEQKDRSKEKIDFALLATLQPEDKLMGYVTCKEMDSDHVYWQYGGIYPDARYTKHTLSGYCMMLNYCGLKYKRITTLIENTNKPMLKLAAKANFIIVGIRSASNAVLLEHLLEFGGK